MHLQMKMFDITTYMETLLQAHNAALDVTVVCVATCFVAACHAAATRWMDVLIAQVLNPAACFPDS